LSSALDSDLFYNKTINRRLGRKELDEIMAYMRKEGTVENVTKGKEEGGVVWVWWRSVDEWSQLIENWVSTCCRNTEHDE
jgi:ESCRT-II complex subunit VPS25